MRFDSKGIIHKKLVPERSIDAKFYLEVME
jgi:hypothetical protein